MSAPSFADEVAASFPDGLALPEPFRRLFDWMEAGGFVRNWGRRPGRFAGLHPGAEYDEAGSSVAFEPVDPDHARYWTGISAPDVTSRLAPFIRTGGDGSYAGLWRDESGAPRWVHFGSGSGSTWAGVFADGPVDVLRLLAIGYHEPAFPDCHDRTPEECAAEEGFPFVPPVLFRTWVTGTFGVTIPARASEILPRVTRMDDEGTGDPFLTWLGEAQTRAEEG